MFDCESKSSIIDFWTLIHTVKLSDFVQILYPLKKIKGIFLRVRLSNKYTVLEKLFPK